MGRACVTSVRTRENALDRSAAETVKFKFFSAFRALSEGVRRACRSTAVSHFAPAAIIWR
jgi:hypothetical protein